jgi:hypothetical protein
MRMATTITSLPPPHLHLRTARSQQESAARRTVIIRKEGKIEPATSEKRETKMTT